MFGHIPVCLDTPVCLGAPIYVGSPICLDALICLDTLPPVCLDTIHMFVYPQYVLTPPVCLGDALDAPCTYTTQRKHALSH